MNAVGIRSSAQLGCGVSSRSRLVVPRAVAGRHVANPSPCIQLRQTQPRGRVASSAVATKPAPAAWLQGLNPFVRKTVEPVIPVISAQQLQIHLQECTDVPVVVIFSAVWCGPCKVMMQRLEKLAVELGPAAVKVVKIDTDESDGGSELATELGIYKLPTIMFCGPQTDKPAVQVQGLVKESVLQDMIINKAQFMGNNLHNNMKW